MTKFNVSAPEADYAGPVGKVQFHDGKAVIDDEQNPAELAYCRSAGYLVVDPESESADSGGADDSDKPFDPTTHDMPAVLAYLKDADEAEAERVLDAEAAASKPRKGIVDQREAVLASKKENVQ